MSFRVEYKFTLTSSEVLNIKSHLFDLGMKELYQKRIVNSIYFDNLMLSSYQDSVEGTLPREKNRIRNYSSDIKKNQLEKKISSYEGRFKNSEYISLNDVSYYKRTGVFSKIYGICKPIISISYLRYYFKLEKFRITFD